MEKRVFIMSDGDVSELLYQRYMSDRGYTTKTLQKQGFTTILDQGAIKSQWVYSERLLQQVVDFHPHLVFCEIGIYSLMADTDYVFEFFEQIRQRLKQPPYPLYLISSTVSSHTPYLSHHELTDRFLPAPFKMDDLAKALEAVEGKMFPPEKRVLIMAGEMEKLYLLMMQREGYTVKVLPEQKRTDRNEDYLGSWLEEVVDFQPHIIICHYGYYGDMDDSFSFFERIHAGMGQVGYPRQLMIGNLGKIDTANPPFGQYRHLVDAFLDAPVGANDLMDVINRLENELFPVEKRVYIMADGETAEQRYQQLMTE